MAEITPVPTQTIIARNAGALYGLQLGYVNMAYYVSQAGSNVDAFLNSVYTDIVRTASTATVADMLIFELGIVDMAAAVYARDYILGHLDSVAYTERGAMVNSVLNTFSNLTSDTTYGAYATAWNTQISNAVAYASVPGNFDSALHTVATPAGGTGTASTAAALELIGVADNGTFAAGNL